MGNNQNLYYTSQYGNIYIQTNKAYYMPGEVVSGNVYVNQTMNFD